MDIEGAEYNLLPCLAQFKDAGRAESSQTPEVYGPFDGCLFVQITCLFGDERSNGTQDELI